MVGLGEERNEVLQLMDDLRSAEVDFLTIGQYLAADAQAPCGDPLRHARRVQGLRDDRLCQGLPDGLVDAADALLAPCRRGFRQAARGPRRAARRLSSGDRSMPIFNSTRRVRHSPEQMFALVADVEKYPQFLPLCEGLTVRRRTPREGGGEVLRRRHERRLQGDPRDLHQPRHARSGEPQDPGRVCRRAVPPSGEPLDLQAASTRGCEVGFFISYEFASRMLGC